jgi:hypothetical protein
MLFFAEAKKSRVKIARFLCCEERAETDERTHKKP